MSAKRGRKSAAPLHHPGKTAQDKQPVLKRQRVADAEWRRSQPSKERTAAHMAAAPRVRAADVEAIDEMTATLGDDA